MTHKLFVLWVAGIFPDALLWLGVVAGVLLFFACLRVYGRLLGRVLAGRGKVWDSPLGLPDVLVVSVLFAWLTATVWAAWNHPRQPLSDEGVAQGAVLFVLLGGGIAVFLNARGIPVARLFGLRPARPLAVLATGAGCFLAALPLVYAGSALGHLLGGSDMEPQEITRYFTQAVEQRNWGRILFATGVTTLVAPMTEEFLFRAYFYGTLRRHLGVLPALLLVSALFAAIHLNIGTLLPLFVLATCLTLAYERTGSLWTPICLHALFNTFMLGVMFYTASHR